MMTQMTEKHMQYPATNQAKHDKIHISDITTFNKSCNKTAFHEIQATEQSWQLEISITESPTSSLNELAPATQCNLHDQLLSQTH